jgi:hypothetical protein
MPNDTVRASATALPKSRRDAIGLFASASALAVMPAVARAAGELSGNPGQLNSRSLEVDPIFAAIKRHNEALRAFTAVCPRTDDVVAREEGREVTDEDEAVWAAAPRRRGGSLRGVRRGIAGHDVRPTRGDPLLPRV